MGLVDKKFDVLIIGAGPAGTVTAYGLRNSGLTVALIDKAQFPREKICGDGLTLDVVNQMSVISAELGEAFKEFTGKLSCSGAEVFSPGFRQIALPVVPEKPDKLMYTCRRIDFDQFLIRQLKPFTNINIFENCIPDRIVRTPGHVAIETSQGVFEGKILVGADGVNSFTARQMEIPRITREHQCVALRTYYRGLKPLKDGNPIEMYLPKEILPGYVWIFHLPDGTANVGIGILASVIHKKKISINKIFEELLQQEPLKNRLAGAERLEPVKGLIIPLGGERRNISGDRFLLAGDAATLVDPITGEGVANAIRSGRIAAEHIIRCFQTDSFDSASNKSYDEEIYRRMMPEFRLHITLRRLLSYPLLINFIVGSALKHKEVEQGLHQVMWNLEGNSAAKKLKNILKIVWLLTFQNLWTSIFRRNK